MENLDQLNDQLRDASAEGIIAWAARQPGPLIASTSFGPNSAALLHLVNKVAPRTPIVWVDSGYNLRDTYLVVQELIESLDLNMKIYVPAMTTERLNVLMGGIPTLEDAVQHEKFTRIVKLDPFNRALDELKPRLWISGIRRDDTDFRKGLDVLSRDGRGILKVAPIFYWSDAQLAGYMAAHQLPSCRHYFDPTKVETGRECGLHTAA